MPHHFPRPALLHLAEQLHHARKRSHLELRCRASLRNGARVRVAGGATRRATRTDRHLRGCLRPAMGQSRSDLPRPHAHSHRRIRNHRDQTRSQIQAGPESHQTGAGQYARVAQPSRRHRSHRRGSTDGAARDGQAARKIGRMPVWGGHCCPPTLTMSKKVPASTIRATTNRPLRKVRILVGRARHQASALSAQLRKLGAQVLEIPFIEIRQPRSYQPLDSALKNLATYDWLILTSVNGVEAMWTRMAKLKLDYADLWEGHDFGRTEKQVSRGGHEFVLEPVLSER